MSNGLMMPEDLSKLGYGEHANYVRVEPSDEASKEASGFVAGTGVKPSRKGKFW